MRRRTQDLGIWFCLFCLFTFSGLLFIQSFFEEVITIPNSLYGAALLICLLVLVLLLLRSYHAPPPTSSLADPEPPAFKPALGPRLETETSSFQLITNVSHDLRTPLTSIRGYAETLLDKNETLPAERRVELLQTILRNADSMTQMIQETLLLSRVEGEELQFGPVSVLELFQTIAQRYQYAAKEHQVQLVFIDVSEELTLLGSGSLLERAIGNLLDNSLRFTSPGDSITVEATAGDSGVKISVIDTGIGIPEHELQNVLQKHYRLERNRPTSNSGAGLGLSIVNSILGKHATELHLESEEGKGTAAWFVLPTAEHGIA